MRDGGKAEQRTEVPSASSDQLIQTLAPLLTSQLMPLPLGFKTIDSKPISSTPSRVNSS